VVLPGLRLSAVSIHLKPGGRGKGGGGRSCAGAAAYRSATRLRDDYLDREFDYGRKAGVLHVELTGWATREGESYTEAQQRLWSEVDRSERRSDSRTFMDLRFTLPRELTIEQQVAVCREIAAAVNRRFGIVIDWALHESHRLRGGAWATHPSSNPHAHMGLTTREPDGEGKFRAAKQVRLYARRALLWIRRMIARIQNEHLKRLDHQVRVTHRSLAAEYRKLNRGRAAEGLPPLETPEATRHRGPRATHRMRRAEASRIEEENRRIGKRNDVVLRFNDQLLALDEPIRVMRMRERTAEAGSVIQSPALLETISRDLPPPRQEGATGPDSEPVRERDELLVEGEKMPALEPPAARVPRDPTLPTRTVALSGDLRREAEERILDLKSLLRRDQEHRDLAESYRARAADLAEQHLPEQSTHVLQAAEDAEGWRRLVTDVRDLAREEPRLRTRLAMRLHSGSRAAWEQRSRGLTELANAIEAMWQARAVVLSDERRTGLEHALQLVVGHLRTLNAAVEQKVQIEARGKGGLDSSLTRGTEGGGVSL
jgi:hypothetical protein